MPAAARDGASRGWTSLVSPARREREGSLAKGLLVQHPGKLLWFAAGGGWEQGGMNGRGPEERCLQPGGLFSSCGSS